MKMTDSINETVNSTINCINDLLLNIAKLKKEYNEVDILTENKDIGMLKQLMKEKVFLSLSDVDPNAEDIQNKIDKEL